MKNNPLSNIHIVNNLIVDGDPTTTAKVTCGLQVSGISMINASNLYCANLEENLRSLLQTLPKEYTLQIHFSQSGSYRNELEKYHQTSETKANEWSQSQRNFHYIKFHDYIQKGIISRKNVHIYISRKITNAGKQRSSKVTPERIETLLKAESHSFERIIEQAKQSFSLIGGKAELLTGEQLFHAYDQALNPSVTPYDAESALHRFQPERSISACCLHGDMQPTKEEECGFYYDGCWHSILAIKSLPSLTCSGIITQLSSLPVKNYSITTLIKPLDLEHEISKEEKQLGILQRALNSKGKPRLKTDLQKSSERINRLASGEVAPFQIQIVIHVWDKDLDVLRNHKITMLKSAILRLQKAQYYTVDNPVMARNYYLSTLPGSPVEEKAFRHQTEDVTVCNLLPVSGNHDDSLDHAEAIYQTTDNGIFGISLFKNAKGNPFISHGLITGKTGFGKSSGTIDLLTQLQPHTDHFFIIEDGNSYGGWVKTFQKQATSFFIDPNGSDTFNYLDTGGMPLSARHRSDVAAILKLMIHKDDRHMVSQSKIEDLVYQFYHHHWNQWVKRSPQFFEHACSEFAIARNYTDLKEHRGLVSNIYPDYIEWKRTSPDSYSKTRKQVAGDSINVADEDLFQFTYAFIPREEMPTHSQLHDWLVERNKADEELLKTNLGSWRADRGSKGCLFDGISNVNFDSSVVHVELGRIADTDKQLKALAGFIVSNYIRNTITMMSRNKRKLVVFEELGKFLSIDNADEMVADFFERGRKYNCPVLAVVQQITKVKPESLRNSILGNSSIALCFRQEDRNNASALQQTFNLPESTTLALTKLHAPTKETGSHFLCWQSGGNDPVIHSACNIVSKEMLWVVDSSGDHYEEKQQALAKHDDVLEGIRIETNC